MVFFKRSPPRSAPQDELTALRRAIQNRGPAKIDEANDYIDRYLGGIFASIDNAGPAQRMWVRDRLRFLMVMSWANWFQILDRIPEGAHLRTEWRMLTQDTVNYGPGTLVAWWWHLDEAVFRPWVEGQLEEMRGTLTEGAREILRNGADYAGNMVNWAGLFR